MKKHDAMPLNELLEVFTNKYGYSEYIILGKIQNTWVDVVGKNVLKHAQPIKLLDGVLFIRTENSIWRNEMLFRKAEILAKINHLHPDYPIKDLNI